MSVSIYKSTIDAIAIALAANVPTILWGGPGEGKTSVIDTLADSFGLHMETVIASLCEPADFGGLPVVGVDEDGMPSVTPAPPLWARNIKKANDGKVEGKAGGIVFYDEVSTAPESVQAAMLRPILSNVIGFLDMGKETRTIAAANPTDIAAGGWDLKPPMANRFLHLDFDTPAEVIRDGFIEGFEEVTPIRPNPAKVAAEVAEAKKMVGMFIGRHTDMKSVVPQQCTNGTYAFPTPRSWENAARLYGFAKAAKADESVTRLLLVGVVGAAAAGEFLTYVAALDLPDPEALLANPDAWPIPADRGDIVYAVGSSIVSALKFNNTGERWSAAGDVFARIANSDYQDLAYAHAVKWAGLKPEGAQMPSAGTMKALAPIMANMNVLINA